MKFKSKVGLGELTIHVKTDATQYMLECPLTYQLGILFIKDNFDLENFEEIDFVNKRQSYDKWQFSALSFSNLGSTFRYITFMNEYLDHDETVPNQMLITDN